MSGGICFVLPSLAGGGAERVMLTLAAGTMARGRPTHLILLSGEGALTDVMPPDLSVEILDKPRLRSALPALRSTLRRLEPDIVVSTMGFLNLGVLAATRLLPRPPKVVVREANTVASTLARVPVPWLGARAYRLLYPRAAAILCNAQHVVDELARFGLPRARIHLLPNPVDEEGLRRRAGEDVPAEGFADFVALGRLAPQKGFDRLIDAVAEMRVPRRVLVLGEGPERAALQTRLADRGLQGSVVLPGFAANPWAPLARSRGLVMTSRWEGFPNAALEALACGVPVFGLSETPGLAELQAAAPEAVRLADDVAGLAALLDGGAVPRVDPSAGPAPSMLPPDYARDEVLQRFDDILVDVDAGLP